MHYYIQDMSTTKGKEKNSSVKGTWVIELSQAIELKENQKFRPGEPNKTKRGSRKTRMRRISRFVWTTRNKVIQTKQSRTRKTQELSEMPFCTLSQKMQENPGVRW